MPIPRTRRRRRAFTLTEVMVTVGVIAVATALVVPTMRDETRLRIMAAATVMASDLEAAQVMTIADPANPIVVRFDAAASSYWLAEAATPETPIIRTDTGDPYHVVLGDGRAMSAEGITMTTTGMTAATIEYTSDGGLDQLTFPPTVRFESGGVWIRLDISPVTGSITEMWGETIIFEQPPDEDPPPKTKGG